LTYLTLPPTNQVHYRDGIKPRWERPMVRWGISKWVRSDPSVNADTPA